MWEWWNDPDGLLAAHIIKQALWDYSGRGFEINRATQWGAGRWLRHSEQCKELIEFLGWPVTGEELARAVREGRVRWHWLKMAMA